MADELEDYIATLQGTGTPAPTTTPVADVDPLESYIQSIQRQQLATPTPVPATQESQGLQNVIGQYSQALAPPTPVDPKDPTGLVGRLQQAAPQAEAQRQAAVAPLASQGGQYSAGDMVDGAKFQKLQQVQSQLKLEDLVTNKYPKMALLDKIKTRQQMTDSFSSYIDHMKHVNGQQADPITSYAQSMEQVNQIMPLDDSEKGIEQGYWKAINATKSDQASLNVGGSPDNTGYNVDVRRGILNAVPSFISSLGSNTEAIDSGIAQGLQWLTNGKTSGQPFFLPTVESDLQQAGALGKSYVDSALPPSEGEVRGDFGSQIASTIGAMAALHGVGLLAKATAGEEDAKLLSKIMLTSYSADMSGNVVQKDAYEANLAKGMSSQDAMTDAKKKGDYARIIMAPIAYATAEFSPLAKLAGGESIAPNLGEKMVVGGLGAGFQFGAQRAVTEGMEYIPHVFDVKEFNANNVYTSFSNATTDAILGVVSGGLIASTEPGMSQDMKQQVQDQYNRQMDVTGKRELRRVGLQELGYPPDINDAWVKTFDSAVSVHADTLESPDPASAQNAAYLSLIANRLQRDIPGMIKMSQPEESAGLYSALREKVLDPKFAQAFPKDADPLQVLSYLKNQPGLKPEELKWTETEDYLKEQAQQGEKVSGKDLLDHLHENEVVLQTTMLGPEMEAGLQTAKGLEEQSATIRDQASKLKDQALKEQNPEKRNTILEQWHNTDQQAQSLWHQSVQARNEARKNAPNYQSITPSGPATGYEEWLLKVPQLSLTTSPELKGQVDEAGRPYQTKPPIEYQPPHFGPEARNTVVHVRLDERVINDKPTMMIHEVQSDWHQEGREEGYKGEPAKTDLGKFHGEAQPPLGPFSKTWNELAWKKILLEAASRGYEQVAWAPGELQDKFQGDPGADAREGRKTFYNKITPQVVSKLLKARGWMGEVGTGEIQTEKGTDVNLYVDQSPNDNQWYMYNIAGERQAGPFATREDAQSHIGLDSSTSQKEPVFLIDLPQPIRDQINKLGFPLFQQSATPKPTDLSTWLGPNEAAKAVWMKDGSVIAGRYKNHIDMITQHSIDPREIRASGLITNTAEGVKFSGDNSYNNYYTRAIKGGTGKVEELPHKVVNEFIPKEKGQVLPDQEGAKPMSLMQFMRNQELFQGQRASVEFSDTGQAILRGLNSPDASSGPHETAHVMRQTMLPQRYLDALEEHFGVKNGSWTMPQEEAFARTMESYIATNRPPSGDLQGAFQLLSDAIKVVYKNASNSPLNIPISEEIHKYFDALFQRERGGVEALREPIIARDKQIADLKNNLSAFDLSTPEGLMDHAQAKMDITKIEKFQAKAVADLQNEQKLVLNPKAETRQERLYKEAQAVPIPPRESPENYWSATRQASELAHWGYEKISHVALISDTETGKAFIQLADDLASRVRLVVGKYQRPMEQVFDSLSGSDTRKLNDFTDGQRNFRQMYDEYSATKPMPADTVGQKAAVGLLARNLAEFDQNTEAINTLRRLNSGDSIPSIAGFLRRMPYMLNQTGRSAIEAGPGHPLFEAYADWVEAHNPDVSRSAFVKEVQANKDSILSRPFGMMEFQKNIKYLPDMIETGGLKHEVTHSSLYDALPRIIERTALRQAVISVAGQKMMENIADPTGVGYKGRLQKLARVFGESLFQTPEEMQSWLRNNTSIDGGVIDTLGKKELMAAVRRNGGSPVVDAYDMLGTLLDKTSDDIASVKNQRLLRSIATDIGGIDSRGQIADVWNEIKRRLSTNVEDDVWKYWRQVHTNEGGDGASFDRFSRIVQGIPEDSLDFSKFHTRLFAAISDIAGSLVTSGSVVKHASRPFRSVSRVGPVNAVKALVDVLSDYNSARDSAIMNGAANVALHNYGPETNSLLSKMSEGIKFGVQAATLSNAVTNFGNVFDATAARYLVQDWLSGGFGKTDVATARSIRLSEPEIRGLLSSKGKEMTTELQAKIIQNIGNTTQGTMENVHRRGTVETSPYLKRIFAFNNFKAMAIRDSVAVAGSIKESVQTGGVAEIAGAGKLFVRYIGAMLGSGFVTQALYGKFKGRPAQGGDDDTWRTLASALFASHMAGVSEHVLDRNGYGGGLEHWIINNAPIVSSLTGIIGTLSGMEGKTADLPIKDRAKATAEQYIPVVGALTNWWEKENNLPRYQTQEVKNSVNAWKQKQPDYKASPPTVTPLNPDYWPVYEAISRYDIEDGVKQMQDYMSKQIAAGVQPRKAALALRESLIERRPVNLDQKNLVKYMMSTDEESRAKALMYQRMYIGMVNRLVPVKAK